MTNPANHPRSDSCSSKPPVPHFEAICGCVQMPYVKTPAMLVTSDWRPQAPTWAALPPFLVHYWELSPQDSCLQGKTECCIRRNRSTAVLGEGGLQQDEHISDPGSKAVDSRPFFNFYKHAVCVDGSCYDSREALPSLPCLRQPEMQSLPDSQESLLLSLQPALTGHCTCLCPLLQAISCPSHQHQSSLRTPI